MVDERPCMSSQEVTALVILVAEAEAVVKELREKYDPSAADGMPAHISVIYPFKPFQDVTQNVIDELTAIIARRSRFAFSLAETKRFPKVLYLAPRPDTPFKELTHDVAAHYPETPPYGGANSEVVPHLTIAHPAEADQLDRIAAEFHLAAEGGLPIDTDAESVQLMVKRQGVWQVLASFELSGT